MNDLDLIKMAIELSASNVESDGGKPFGAVVVKDGRVIGKGVNQSLSSMDPTSHSEMMAIRMACQQEQSLDLSGCVIYCSAEPCPMCTAAIHLARVSRVVYSVPGETVADYELSDRSIYEQLSLPKQNRKLKMEQLFVAESIDALKTWSEKHARR